MARIERFVRSDLSRITLHDPIEANLFTFELDGRKLIQINTSGRSSREMPGKTSQSIQLGEEAARELFGVLKQHYGFS